MHSHVCSLRPQIFADKHKIYGVGVGEGFSGGLVGDGKGGAVSGTTLRVGSGRAGALRLLFALLLLLLFSFSFASGLGSSITSGETAAFAFTFAGGVIVPPEGSPS